MIRLDTIAEIDTEIKFLDEVIEHICAISIVGEGEVVRGLCEDNLIKLRRALKLRWAEMVRIKIASSQLVLKEV